MRTKDEIQARIIALQEGLELTRNKAKMREQKNDFVGAADAYYDCHVLNFAIQALRWTITLND